MMKQTINPIELAKEFDLKISGATKHQIIIPSSFDNQNTNSIIWVKEEKFLSELKSGYAIVHESFELPENNAITYLITKAKPRLIFAKILDKYFNNLPTAFNNCTNDFKKNKSLVIGENCFIDSTVVIGDGTIIYPNVMIYGNVKIGRNCVIQSFTTIGSIGIAIEMDEESDEYVKFPQIGGVIIEDNVDIGAHSNIQRAALTNTIIGKGTKIGPYVNIGHNTIIGKNCMITSQTNTSGTSQIGNNVILGVGCSIKNGIHVGNNATIGQHAVVTKNVPEGATYIGTPAMNINEYKKLNKK
jgi:UDP-3-O-[3-hydroxymyristoyl] glucosamine N-acyltransferase